MRIFNVVAPVVPSAASTADEISDVTVGSSANAADADVSGEFVRTSANVAVFGALVFLCWSTRKMRFATCPTALHLLPSSQT